MEWVRVHPLVMRHPRIVEAGAWAAVVIKAAWEMSKAHELNGVLPLSYWTPKFFAEWTLFHDVRGSIAWMKRGMAACTDKGLAEICDDGVHLHDWGQHNPPGEATCADVSARVGTCPDVPIVSQVRVRAAALKDKSNIRLKNKEDEKVNEDVKRGKGVKGGSLKGGLGENPTLPQPDSNVQEQLQWGYHARGPNKGKPRMVNRYTGGADGVWYDWMEMQFVPRSELNRLWKEEWHARFPEVDILSVVRRAEVWMKHNPSKGRRYQKLGRWLERVFIMPAAEKVRARGNTRPRRLDGVTEQQKGKDHGDWEGITQK